LKRFFDPSKTLLKPSHIVSAFTGRKPDELLLPERAIITFSAQDLRRITGKRETLSCEAWRPFRSLFLIKGSDTLITRSGFGGPNIASLVEELSAFGVKEFVLWGYCGGIKEGIRIGDIIIATKALREDGVSYHYLERNDSFVECNWLEEWVSSNPAQSFHRGAVWSCDAVYRETVSKIGLYGEHGILAVEMEVASFYAVCRFKNVSGVAFLVVSDRFSHGLWTGGFRTKPFREGVERLTEFVLAEAVS